MTAKIPKPKGSNISECKFDPPFCVEYLLLVVGMSIEVESSAQSFKLVAKGVPDQWLFGKERKKWRERKREGRVKGLEGECFRTFEGHLGKVSMQVLCKERPR
jgi:hypothetical protein